MIKLLVFKLIHGLFTELKERYVTLIQDIIPYILECLEDSNEKVNTEAFTLIKFIEKETGEDIKSYLES